MGVRPVPGRKRLVVGVTVGMSADLLLRGQLAWFREQGWDVTLISTPDDQAQRAATREGVELLGIPMARGISPLSDLTGLVAWVRALRRLRPDAVNVGTPKAALLGSIAAWLTRVPRRLYTVRGLRLEGSSGPLSRVLWLMEWVTMRAATDVLFVSASLAEEAERRRLPIAGKKRLIGQGSSNGVDAAAVQTRVSQVDRGALRAELGLSDEDFVVGFVGRINPDKGTDVIARASRSAELDPRVKFLMIGSLESPELRTGLASPDSRLRHVEWTDDVWGHLAAMDALCLPTLREGFPNVVLEAAAAGLPVVTTTATGAVDSVVEGQTGFLIPVGDDAALVARLNTLADQPDLAASMGAAGRQRVLEHFGQEQIWRGIEHILTGHTTHDTKGVIT